MIDANSLQRASRGFTLLEIMVVISLVGILAAIAVPRYAKFTCKAKQSELKSNLHIVQGAIEAWLAENDSGGPFTATYNGCTGTGPAENVLGIIFKGKSRYSYALTYGPNLGGGLGRGFIAVVTGCGADMVGDLWTFNDNTSAPGGALVATTNVCSNPS